MMAQPDGFFRGYNLTIAYRTIHGNYTHTIKFSHRMSAPAVMAIGRTKLNDILSMMVTHDTTIAIRPDHTDTEVHLRNDDSMIAHEVGMRACDIETVSVTIVNVNYNQDHDDIRLTNDKEYSVLRCLGLLDHEP